MAAGIAHEIRNPLASMSGSIQILRQELPLSSEQEQLMDIVLRESERLNTTIRSFLAYARPQRFQIARFDVRRALNDAALLLRNSAEVHDGHVIDVDVPPHRAVVRGRRRADQADRLEPRDQRPARDAGRRPAAPDRRRRAGVGRRRADRAGRRRRHSARGARRPLSAVPRHVRARAAASGSPSSTASSPTTTARFSVSSQPGAGTTVSVRLPARAAVTS